MTGLQKQKAGTVSGSSLCIAAASLPSLNRISAQARTGIADAVGDARSRARLRKVISTQIESPAGRWRP
jgi:hypothetical protein